MLLQYVDNLSRLLFYEPAYDFYGTELTSR